MLATENSAVAGANVNQLPMQEDNVRFRFSLVGCILGYEFVSEGNGLIDLWIDRYLSETKTDPDITLALTVVEAASSVPLVTASFILLAVWLRLDSFGASE